MDSSADSPFIGTVRSLGTVSNPLPVQIAQAVGLTTSAWLAAQTTTLSTLTIPAILLSPAPLLLTQWRTLARIARSYTPLLRVLASSIFTYLATRQPSRHTPSFKLYAAAALLIPSTIPYALLVSRSTAAELAARAEQATSDPAAITAQEAAIARDQKRKTPFPEEFAAHSFPQFISTHVTPGITWPFFDSGGVVAPAAAELSAHQLVDKWAWLNLGAAAITAAGAAAAAWGAACEEFRLVEFVFQTPLATDP